MDDQWDEPTFSRSLFQCLVLERKIAQINFYINMIQRSSAVEEVLALIPHGKELFRCHPPLSDTEMFCIIDDNTLHADNEKFDFVASCTSGQTKGESKGPPCLYMYRGVYVEDSSHRECVFRFF